MGESLLLSFFQSLRSQLGLDLEMAKYGDLLQFAKEGYPMSERQALLDLCRALWLVDSRESRNFDELFEEYWPDAEKTDTPKEKVPHIKKKESKLRQPTSHLKTKTTKQQKQTGKKTEGPQQIYLGYSGGTRIPTTPMDSLGQHGFDFSPSFHTVEKRLLHQRLRNTFLSKKKDFDLATIDLATTVSFWAKNRILDHPVYYKRRILPKKILFLIDHLGSMEPFGGLANFLIQNFKEAVPGAEVEVFYFHNNLSFQLFKNPGHTRAVSLNDVIHQFGGKNNALVIFSDAGTSKQRIHRERTEITIKFLESVANQFTRLLWVNPIPKERWRENEAARLAKIAPMVEFSENDVRLLPKIFPWDFFVRHEKLDYYEMPSYVDGVNPDIRPYLIWFWENYGQYSYGHWQLLEYAAFLPAFSTELLYKLRKNFPFDMYGNEIPYIAVADLIRSPLCQTLGLGLFQLREEIKQTLPFGSLSKEGELNKRLRLARFLLYYIQDHSNDKNIPSPHYRQALKDCANLEENLNPNLERLIKLAYQGVEKEGQNFEEGVAELYDLALIAPETKGYLQEGIDLAKDIMDAREKGTLNWEGFWSSRKHQLKSWESKSSDIKIPLPGKEAEAVLRKLFEEDINIRVNEDSRVDTGINLLEEVADTYFIQSIEEALRKQGKLKLEYYFDSSDVIKMLKGAMGYTAGIRFNREALKRDEQKNSVYALAFSGFFGTIHMLPPHLHEFILKLDKPLAYFKTPRGGKELLELFNEVLFSYSIDNWGNSRELEASNIDKFMENLVHDGASLFKANYLLKEDSKWELRLKYLVERQILALGEQDQQQEEINDRDLFDLIKKAFDEIRPEFSKNNHIDALAFYHLQKRLDAFKKSNGWSEPLPVFFASSPVIKEAISDIRSINPELFAYPYEDKLIPIVRDSLFFVLEAVFTLEDHTLDFFKVLKEAKEDIRSLVQKEYENRFDRGEAVVTGLEHARKQFEDKIKELINVKFVQEIWIKEKAYQQLVDELKNIYIIKDSDLPIVKERIQETLEEALANARINLSNSRKLNAIIDNFQNVSKDIDKCLGHVPSSDVFLDFALMKFGLDERKLPFLQENVAALVYYKLDGSGYPPVIYNVISSLTIMPDYNEKAVQFLSGITVAWLLNKHDLIVALCADLDREDMKKRYETALIYAASLIAIKRNAAGIKRTQEIIDCILSQVKNNYKVWLGVAHLYFQMWESKTSLKPDLPEMNKKVSERQRNSKDYERYVLNGAMKYSRKAFSYLKKKKKEEGLHHNFRLQNFLYALNNVIYYTTKCGSPDEFFKLENLVEELHSYDKNIEWQGRFNDTLGWYYLRRYYQIDHEKLRKGYLEESEINYRLSLTRLASPRDQRLYEHLHRAILRAIADEEKGKFER